MLFAPPCSYLWNGTFLSYLYARRSHLLGGQCFTISQTTLFAIRPRRSIRRVTTDKKRSLLFVRDLFLDTFEKVSLVEKNGFYVWTKTTEDLIKKSDKCKSQADISQH